MVLLPLRVQCSRVSGIRAQWHVFGSLDFYELGDFGERSIAYEGVFDFR